MLYTHIYVEKEAADYPISKRILERNTSAGVITINHYKDIFNRAHQDYRMQKRSPALILAVRHGNRIFAGAPVCQSFGQQNFFYASSVMNCPFDCEYCYLKGMYQTPYTVVFVNFEDYAEEVRDRLRSGNCYLCVSYDTDLLALNGLTGIADEWIKLAESSEGLQIEIRTKSAPQRLEPCGNVIYAFTLSPEIVAEKFEHMTPPLGARLAAVRRAQETGCRVRLCFDPMIKVDGWERIYPDFIDEVARNIDLDRVIDFSVGTFRISKDYLGRMRRNCPDSQIAWYPYVTKDNVCQYPQQTDAAMQNLIVDKLESYNCTGRIFKWN